MSEELALDDTPPRSRARVETVSDGVFAIALTLLTLNVKLSQGPNETFAHALRHTVPELLAYGLSFAVISLLWVGHHRFFAVLRGADHGLVLANFAYLGIVALVPFPSQVLGQAKGGEAGPEILYATVLLVAAATSALMWLYASRRRLIDPATPRRLVSHSVLRSVVFAVVFALSIPVAILFGAHAGEWTWLAALPGLFVLGRRYGNLHDVVW